jgi:hypothetical protein
MSLDSLEQPRDNPNVHRHDMQADSLVDEEGQVLGCESKEEGAADRAGAEDEDFERVSVFGCETKGRRELVVELVDVLTRKKERRETNGELLLSSRERAQEDKRRREGKRKRTDLVKHRRVKPPVRKVVERILKHEKDGNLPGDRLERGEGDRVGRHAKVLCHGVETPDLLATKRRHEHKDLRGNLRESVFPMEAEEGPGLEEDEPEEAQR